MNERFAVVEYFGEKKRVRNDFYKVNIGDYVYAQGGFIIRTISAAEAELALETWREMFEELNKIDLRLAEKTENLRQIANNIRRRYTGNSSCVHGIIEFSNHCSNNCLYCGLRRDNTALERYRMTPEEMIEAGDYAINKFGFKALVFQSGEDSYYDDDNLAYVIETIMKKNPVLLILSIGERDISTYRRLYRAGARGVLMRFETSNPEIYAKMRPGHRLEDRLNLIREIKETGYLIMSGFLIGLPGQTEKDIARDIETTSSLGVEMFSFGPLIPAAGTPLSDVPAPDVNLVIDTIARTRILCPESRILVTTATETLDKQNAAQNALLAGANSVMINVTPEKYHSLYYLYPERAGLGEDIPTRIAKTIDLLKSLGRAPSDLGL